MADNNRMPNSDRNNINYTLWDVHLHPTGVRNAPSKANPHSEQVVLEAC